MNPEIEIKIELRPIIKQDKKTGAWVAYFEQFPRASASAPTPEVAQRELNEIFTVMLQEQYDDIVREIVEKYMQFAPARSHQTLKDVRVYA